MLNYDELLENYLTSRIDAEPPFLTEVYRHTHLHHLYPRMCSGHYQGRLLKMIAAMVNPDRVLEIGTFTGYATLSLAEGINPDAVIDTIEIDDEKEAELLSRFADSPYAGRIRLHIGDALDIVGKLEGPYGLVYIDGNKRQYQDYLESVVGLVPKGGFILVDNTLWDMKVLETVAVSDAQTKAVAEFNDRLASDTRFEKIILPVRDGLTIIRKIV